MKPAARRLVLGIALAGLLLGACVRHDPELTGRVPSPTGVHVAKVVGYEAMGTVEGYLNLTIDTVKPANSIVLRHIENGVVGWTSDSDLVVVGSHVEFTNMSSRYYPNGDASSRVSLTVCDRERLDCTPLEGKISKGKAMKIPPVFPSR